MSKKPKLSVASIVNMSVGFFGIQFGFALQNGNVSRIFQTLGAHIDEIPILWVAAPMTGLIVQPIIGYISDRTWHKRWGRRRPFFFIGAVLASLALLLMPNSSSLWIAAGMLWVLDASINISMEPFRAFVGDNLPDEQRTMGFAMQSFFIGAGAYIASWLPALFDIFGVSNTAEPGIVPDTVKLSFYVGGIVFFLSVLYTVLTTKEYSPDELRVFEDDNISQKTNIVAPSIPAQKLLTIGVSGLVLGILLSYLIYHFQLKKDLYILSIGIITLFGLFYFIGGFMKSSGVVNGFTNILDDFLTMPRTMKQLAVVQFFSWFALFSFWIYSTAAITEHIYGTTDPTSGTYNEGANTVSGMMGNYNLIAAVVAFIIPLIAARTSRKFTHFLSLTLGGLGLISIYFMGQGLLLQWLPMIGLGIAWSSILSVPYAILSGSLPAEKMGYYMGVFNFFIVIPQLVAASLLGFILSTFFNNTPIYALIVGGFSMILAGVLTFFVSDTQD